MKISTTAIVLLAIGLPAAAANAQGSGDEVAELRQMIIEMRDDYERRISELEARLDTAERQARAAKRDAGEAFELAEEASIRQAFERRINNDSETEFAEACKQVERIGEWRLKDMLPQ